MHGHLFEHVENKALLYHSGGSPWEVYVENMQFTTGIRDFLQENNIELRYELLIHHIGRFRFEVILSRLQNALGAHQAPDGRLAPRRAPRMV